MSEMQPSQAAQYQDLLNTQARLIRESRSSHDVQQVHTAGSAQRDAQGRVTEKLWDDLGKVAGELRDAGIIDGRGILTEKAQKLGLKDPSAQY